MTNSSIDKDSMFYNNNKISTNRVLANLNIKYKINEIILGRSIQLPIIPSKYAPNYPDIFLNKRNNDY